MLRPNRALEHLLAGGDLTQEHAGELLGVLADAEVEPALKGALLTALRTKGETPDEVRGFALAMRQAAVQVDVPRDQVLVDTCGTGGDGSDSINLSTATSLVVAAAGVRVVKHGNRSVSSRSGSADVLEHLGLRRASTPEEAAAELAEFGYTFLFAPAFHPVMKAILPIRRAMGVRTVFNLLGPLTNPARPDVQLLGAFSESAAELMAYALAGTQLRRAFVVHGYPGWDEATPCGPFVRFDVRSGHVVREELDPAERYGLPLCQPKDLAGGDPAHNAERLRAIFAGERGPQRDAVVLNTALVFELCGRASSPLDAVAQAQQVIDSCAVTQLVARMAGSAVG